MFRKQPKPRVFDYRPRYFDPQKEETNWLKSGKHSAKDNLEGMRTRISRHFRTYNTGSSIRQDSTRSQIWSSNLRLVIILLGLMLAAYWFLSANMSRILSFLE